MADPRIPCAPLRRFLAQEKFVAPKRVANTARCVRYPTLRPAARIVVSDPEGTVVSHKDRNLLRIVRVLAVRAARDDRFNTRVS
jgi:hypothetical protein